MTIEEIDRLFAEQQKRLTAVPTTWTKNQVDTLVADVESVMRSLNAQRARALRFAR